jgi:hypothetical protein
MCSLDMMFQEPCSSRLDVAVATVHMAAIHYASGPMHAATLLHQVGGCAPIAAHSRAKRRVTLHGLSWDVAAEPGDCKHLKVRSVQS